MYNNEIQFHQNIYALLTENTHLWKWNESIGVFRGREMKRERWFSEKFDMTRADSTTIDKMNIEQKIVYST